MADQKIKWTFLTPQLTVGTINDAIQISTTREIARSVLIAADVDNVGTIKVADTEANVDSGNSVKLEANEFFRIEPDNYDNIDQYIDLREWFWSGDTTSDKITVQILWEEE